MRLRELAAEAREGLVRDACTSWRTTLGFIELSLGDAAAAHRLGPLAERIVVAIGHAGPRILASAQAAPLEEELETIDPYYAPRTRMALRLVGRSKTRVRGRLSRSSTGVRSRPATSTRAAGCSSRSPSSSRQRRT